MNDSMDGLLLLAQGSPVPGLPAPNAVVNAAAAGDAVKLLSLLCIGAFALLAFMIILYAKERTARETGVAAEKAAGDVRVEALRTAKDLIIAGKDAEYRAVLEKRYRDQKRLQKVAEKLLELEAEDEEPEEDA